MSSLDSLLSSPAENASSVDYYDTQYQSDDSEIISSLDDDKEKETNTPSPAILENTLETIALKAELKKVEDLVRKLEKNIIELNQKLSDITMHNTKLKFEIEYFRYKSKEYYFLAKAKGVESEFMDKYGYSLDKTIYWNE